MNTKKKRVFFVGNNVATATQQKKKGRRKITQGEINKCLNCNKHVSECTGNCKF